MSERRISKNQDRMIEGDVMKDGWIDQLNRLYRKIVRTPTIPAENLDKANEVICEAIEKLRPLAKER